MADDSIKSLQEGLSELRQLAAAKTLDAGLDTVSCAALIDILASTLGLSTRLPRDSWIIVLKQAMSGAAHDAREAVLRNSTTAFDPQLSEHCRVAAAGELFDFTDEGHFVEFLRRSRKLKDWEYESKKRDNRGSARVRALRAGFWISRSVTSARGRYKEGLLRSFLIAISDYASNPKNQRELRKLFPSGTSLPVASVLDVAVPAPATPVHAPIDPRLQPVANHLVWKLQEQLESDQRQNRPHNSPISDYPLIPIRWEPEKSLSGDLKLASIAFGHGNKPLVIPKTMDGLANLVEAAPDGRLVILGAAGAGKTTLITQLALDLLKARRRNEAGVIPCVFRLTSWRGSPKDESLAAWLEEQLIESLPSLGKASEAEGDEQVTYARSLLAAKQILPILDGFDEIATPLRQKFIQLLNQSRIGAIVTSRKAEFADVIRETETIHGAAVIELKGLELEEIKYHLVEVPAYGPIDTEVWQPVFEYVRRNAQNPASKALLEALATPLMVTLAKETYSQGGEPLKLLDAQLYPNKTAVQDHLLSQYVPSRYATGSDRESGLKRYRPEDAQRWLRFLAAMLTDQRTSEFAWWKLDTHMFDAPVAILGIASLGIIGYAGITLLVVHETLRRTLWSTAIETSLIILAGISFLVTLMFAYSEKLEPRSFQPWPSLRSFTAARQSVDPRIAGVPVFLVLATSVMAWGISDKIFAIPLSLLTLGVPLLWSPPSKTAESTPSRLLRNDQLVAIMRVVPFALSASLFGIAEWLIKDDWKQVLVLFPTFIFASLLLLSTAAGHWHFNAIALSRRGLVPWRYMRFLENAHRRGILRQAGGVYQFRHALLQGHLTKGYIREKPRYTMYLQIRLIRWLFDEGHASYAETTRDLRALITHLEQRESEDALAEARQLLTEILVKNGSLKEAAIQLELLPRPGRFGAISPHGTRGYKTLLLDIEYFEAMGDLERAGSVREKLKAVLKRDLIDTFRGEEAGELLSKL